MEIEFHGVQEPPAPFREEFFFGIWHPESRIALRRCAPGTDGDAVRLGRNWALVGSCLTRGNPGSSLVHARSWTAGNDPRHPDRALDALAFRGYLLDPPIHSWSPSEALFEYWENAHREHDGVFSAALIAREGRTLTICSDVFGISPIYFRRIGDLVLFASAPRYLRQRGDGLDAVAARMIMQRGALCGDVSLVPGVRRVPPGRVVTFSDEGVRETFWFDYGSLPAGDLPITSTNLIAAEQSFQESMSRCCRLMPDVESVVPFSSGDDSRRIAASLHAHRQPFRASTVSGLIKGRYDYDGLLTPPMAARFGFRHRVLPAADAECYATHDRWCRWLFSSEVSDHTWMWPMIEDLGGGPQLVFDGLVGDIVGNTGFGEAFLYELRGEALLEALARLAFGPPRIRALSDDAWVPARAVDEVLKDHLRFLPENLNRCDLAFLLIRARRGVAPWSQHLLPVGNIAVYPYLVLNHVRTTLQYDPRDKLKQTLQARCLQAYWPEYYSFPGSRRPPPDFPAVRRKTADDLVLARVRQLFYECGRSVWKEELAEWLTGPAWCAALATRLAPRMTLSTGWWLRPLLMLAAEKRSGAAAIVVR